MFDNAKLTCGLMSLVVATAVLCVCGAASADLIVQYDFTSAAGSQASQAYSILNLGVASASDITRGSGVTASTSMNSMNSTSWTTSASIDPNDYYELSIVLDAGAQLTLDNIQFGERRTNDGVLLVDVRTSQDGFAGAVETVTLPDNAGSNRDQTISLSSLGSIVGGITLRLYGYGAESEGGEWGLRNGSFGGLTVNGTLAAVPEPTAFLFGSLVAGSVGMVVARRRPARRPLTECVV